MLVTPTLRRGRPIHHTTATFARDAFNASHAIAHSIDVAVLLVAGASAGALALALRPAARPRRAASRSRRTCPSRPTCGRRSTSATPTTHPDTIGIRGSMPGLGDRGAPLWMRFQVQYLAKRGRQVAQRRRQRRLRAGRRSAGTRSRWSSPARTSRSAADRRRRAQAARRRSCFKWVRARQGRRAGARVTEAGHRSTAGRRPAPATAPRDLPDHLRRRTARGSLVITPVTPMRSSCAIARRRRPSRRRARRPRRARG